MPTGQRGGCLEAARTTITPSPKCLSLQRLLLCLRHLKPGGGGRHCYNWGVFPFLFSSPLSPDTFTFSSSAARPRKKRERRHATRTPPTHWTWHTLFWDTTLRIHVYVCAREGIHEPPHGFANPHIHVGILLSGTWQHATHVRTRTWQVSFRMGWLRLVDSLKL